MFESSVGEFFVFI